MQKFITSFLRVWRVSLILAAVLSISEISDGYAQEKDSSLQPGQPPEVQIVQTKDATVITLAGVGPQDQERKLVGAGDFAAQFKQTLDNLQRLTLGAGGVLRNILSITVYTADAKWQDTFTALQQENSSGWNPATNFVVTRQLRTPGALLEIHAVAVIDKRKPIRP